MMGERFPGPEPVDAFDQLVEVFLPAANGGEGKIHHAVFPFEPSGTDPEHRAAAREIVEIGLHAGNECRMTIGGRHDELTEV